LWKKSNTGDQAEKNKKSVSSELHNAGEKKKAALGGWKCKKKKGRAGPGRV